MKQHLTLKNLGWLLTALISLLLVASASGKIMMAQETLDMLGSHNLKEWTRIIGIGELISLILFVIPKTMRLGALLLSAYFGGAIVFHMAHPDPMMTAFVGPAGILVFIWVISWIRGLKVIDI